MLLQAAEVQGEHLTRAGALRNHTMDKREWAACKFADQLCEYSMEQS